MKLLGIVGSNADHSYNRLLLNFMARKFSHIAEIEVIEIKDIPLFNQSDDQTNCAAIQNLKQKIEEADGVIIATPEHNRTIPAALKSVIEWLSFKIHPLQDKPVMVVGASYSSQGSSRAQLDLRQILNAPGVNAMVLPGNEFLLGNVKDAFDDAGNLTDQETIIFLQSTLGKFLKFITLVTDLDNAPKPVLPAEDLHASGKISTTIEGVDMSADDWVEVASQKVGAVEGETYVKLNRGILTVDQLNYFLSSMPMELTYADSNNQFLYYNLTKPGDEMLASRVPGQVGNPLIDCHPEKALKGVEWVVQQLRSGATDCVRVNVPTHGADKYVVHNYQAIHDDNGEYVGINEYILDFKPIIDWYLQQTGQTLTGDVDAVTSASQRNNQADAVSGASEKA